MDIGTAIKTCFSKYAVFSGRAARSEYWYFGLFTFLVCIAIMVLSLVVAAMGNGSGLTVGIARGFAFLGIFFMPIAAYGLVVLLPSLSVTVRRFHDLGVSGWFLLLFMVLACIPVINFLAGLAQLIWFCMPGTSGDNKYGPNPLAGNPALPAENKA